MSSNPWDGITERITNAMDAMIELEAELNPSLKRADGPRKTIEQIHDLKDGNLRWADQKKLGELASDIKVKFLDGDKKKAPTIEIHDKGIGQHPSNFPETLLSINSNYKAKKFYLIGAFGQGGQTSFAHCPYGIVISKKHPQLLTSDQRDVVGWSIVRYIDPSTEVDIHKFGLWEYCVDSKTGRVPEVIPSILRIAFEHGTLIRLIAYDLPKGTSDVLQPAGTAWSIFSQSLFDPLLSIRLHEGRKKYQPKNRPLSGLAPRLWRGGKGEKVRIFDNSYDIDMGEHGKIKINYWTLEPIEESGEKTKWRDIRKGFVSRNSAVFITLNGQRHGVEKKSFLNDDANLKYSDDYIIVQVDCDNLTNYAKKKLLSSTRERLKEGEMKEILMEELATHLRNDRNLLAFEKKRKNEILSAKTHRDTSKIRKMVGKFISRNPELNKLLLKQGKEDISGTKQPKTKVEKEEEDIEDQIKDEELESPDLKPEPTFLKIANAKDPIPIEKGGSALVRLETDAEDSYLEEGNEERFRCIHQSNQTTPKSLSQLRGGKISYYVHCPRSIWVGTKETLRFELDRANKPALVVEREITCRKPFKRKKRKRETKLQEPSIKFISKKDSLWNQLSYDNNSVGQIYLAGKDSAIIVSMENIHLQKALRTRRLKESLIETVKDRYGAAIAYYLLLQEVDKKKKVKEAIDESNDSPELQRLAKTISLLALPTEAL